MFVGFTTLTMKHRGRSNKNWEDDWKMGDWSIKHCGLTSGEGAFSWPRKPGNIRECCLLAGSNEGIGICMICLTCGASDCFSMSIPKQWNDDIGMSKAVRMDPQSSVRCWKRCRQYCTQYMCAHQEQQGDFPKMGGESKINVEIRSWGWQTSPDIRNQRQDHQPQMVLLSFFALFARDVTKGFGHEMGLRIGFLHFGRPWMAGIQDYVGYLYII